MNASSRTGMVVERFGTPTPRGPVLLLHGLGGPLMWEKVVPMLTHFGEVIVPHLPGFGESPAPRGRLSSRDHALLLHDLVGELGISGITVAGISYGGMVAAKLTAHDPRPVRKLVLLCPSGLTGSGIPLRFFSGTPPGRWLLRRALASRRLAAFAGLRSFHDRASRPPDLPARAFTQLSLPGHTVALIDALGEIASGEAPLGGLIPRLPPDTIVAWGEEDRVLPVRNISGQGAEWFRDRIVLFPLCGHSLPMENPAGIARLIGG